jgi:hypothetical protein
VINNRISEHVFTLLGNIGVPTHFIRRLNMREQLVRQVEIVPIEVVVRNVAAGSLSKRLGIEEGAQLPRTLIEYYYKDDALGDPMITEEHIACFGWASQEEMHDIADMAIRVNDFMSGLFAGDRHPPRRFQARIRTPLGWRLQPRHPGRRDQPRWLPPVGHGPPAKSSTRTASAAIWAAKWKPIRKSPGAWGFWRITHGVVAP